MKVYCDECGERFAITSVKKKVVGSHKGQKVTFHFFSCPHCGAKYTTHVETKSIQKKIDKIKWHQEQHLKKALDDHIRDEHMKCAERLDREVVATQQELKERYFV